MEKTESQSQNTWKNFPPNTENVVGFIYLIRNNHPDVIKNNGKRYYIGKKKMLKKVKRKPLKGKTRNRISYVDNGVDKYWGSSKELLLDIEQYGIEHFSREVIEICYSKFEMTWMELKWQMACNVLFDNTFYNQIINIRLSRVPKDFVDKEITPVDVFNLLNR